MPIHIQEINLQNLGPHDQLSLRLGKFNLIYGRNERGKTYLVEFIIRSLFRNASQWKLREEKGKGKLILSGLPNGATGEFSPDTLKKLEDYWEEGSVGLPPDFSRLLVVKGAEVALADVDGGVDKAILKKLLSSKDILDKIENHISKTILESTFEHGIINGPRRGELKEKEALEERLGKLNRLFEQIDKGYSGGRRQALSEKKQKLQGEIDRLLTAKRFLAFTFEREIRRLREQRNRIPAETIQEVRSQLALYRQKEFEYQRKQEIRQAAEQNSKDFEWLKHAHEVYRDALQTKPAKPNLIFLILAVLFLLASGVLMFLNLPYYAIGTLVGVLFLGFLYLRKYRSFLDRAAENQEIANLKKEFYARFQYELTGLPRILELLQNVEEDYNTARLLNRQLEDDVKQLHVLKLAISDLIFDLVGERKDPKTWDEVVKTVESNLRKLDSRIREKEIQHAKLAVDASDYETRPVGIEYSKQKLDALEAQFQQTQAEIDAENQKLYSLKQLLCQETGDDIAESWELIIKNLQERREAILCTLQQKTAEIIGKIAVKEVIAELRQDEDSKILAGLKSADVQQPLFQLTNRYKSVQLHDQRLMVSDAFNDFLLSELSTGAQEQVLLAMRIGFSTKVMQQDKLFLILDDAFQYSDWQRRKLLMEKIVALAKSGWQIIYFTMDDNIRELFVHKGKSFGDAFKLIELDDSPKIGVPPFPERAVTHRARK